MDMSESLARTTIISKNDWVESREKRERDHLKGEVDHFEKWSKFRQKHLQNLQNTTVITEIYDFVHSFLLYLINFHILFVGVDDRVHEHCMKFVFRILSIYFLLQFLKIPLSIKQQHSTTGLDFVCFYSPSVIECHEWVFYLPVFWFFWWHFIVWKILKFFSICSLFFKIPWYPFASKCFSVNLSTCCISL